MGEWIQQSLMFRGPRRPRKFDGQVEYIKPASFCVAKCAIEPAQSHCSPSCRSPCLLTWAFLTSAGPDPHTQIRLHQRSRQFSACVSRRGSTSHPSIISALSLLCTVMFKSAARARLPASLLRRPVLTSHTPRVRPVLKTKPGRLIASSL